MEVTINSVKLCELVTVTGRIDSNTSPELLEALTRITDQNKYKIILDLGGVTYVSSAGLRVLIDIQRKCKKDHQGELLLLNIPQRVYETLELAGFVPLFKFFTNVDLALAEF